MAWHRCMPAAGMRQHVREQQALIDLGAVFVALLQAVFARELVRRSAPVPARPPRLRAPNARPARILRNRRSGGDRSSRHGRREIFRAPRGPAPGSRPRRRLALPSARAFAAGSAISSPPIRHCREKFSASRRKSPRDGIVAFAPRRDALPRQAGAFETVHGEVSSTTVISIPV